MLQKSFGKITEDKYLVTIGFDLKYHVTRYALIVQSLCFRASLVQPCAGRTATESQGVVAARLGVLPVGRSALRPRAPGV